MPAPHAFAMFPLGTVLFPRGVLPLSVFESRYLEMVSDVLEQEGRFGVVLIERGSEVGGGDHRFDVGTHARIVRAGRVDPGRLAIVAVGLRRIRVEEWLPDDPYPRAMVSELPEVQSPVDDLPGLVETARRKLRRLLALASELGVDVGAIDPSLPDRPAAAVWTLCSVAPLEQLDRQRLLELDDPRERVTTLLDALDDQVATMEFRLAGG